ncbi:hypothetical protein AMATHDRAFT_79225 [Amanita thiersii Skay4041]|uniref:Uncharacterized protein n=1 Tax=Amanita thiersii Skay4041 TaxID=703135 RepID=A0A2A9NR82_9AGAR|nr:hypothetical protein AMATHDRAFT_79225 [Amanita thiersii Skay4041]
MARLPKNIWVAAGDGDINRVRELVDYHSFSPNVPDEHTYTPMHAAASYGQLDVLRYLISRGGNINITDADGDTPLYTVENIETARFLIQHGAIVDHRNNEGISPIEYLQEDYPAVANYLLSLTSSTVNSVAVPAQPSQHHQEAVSEELTSQLMASVHDIMQRAEEEGRDPEEELRQVIGRTVVDSIVTGYGMTTREGENRGEEMDDSPSKRSRGDDSTG